MLPRIAVPTLLLWGELDARSPLGVAAPVRGGDPRTRSSSCYPSAGHVSNLEQPEPFNEAVRAFCRAHAPDQA